MDSRKAWKGAPNGEEPNHQMKQFNGFNKGATPMAQGDAMAAGDNAMHISAKHNTKASPKRAPSDNDASEQYK